MSVNDSDRASFAWLLRAYREAAFLSQEALAARAGLSARAISDLERGIKQRPHNETLALLIRALALTDEQAAAFRAQARRARGTAGGMADRTPPPAREASPATQGAQPEPRRVEPVRPTPPPGNLPLALTSFIGQEQAQAKVRHLLSTHRLVTLTGAGGCGKTRLALQVAGTLTTTYPDGVVLAALAPLADPAQVCATVVETLHLPEDPGRPALATLVAHLRERHMLLVLDNCEHVVSACAELAAALLRACPQVRLLATSREDLGVAEEQLYRVPSLSLPSDMHRPLAEIAASEAVLLFVERAQTHAGDFALTAANAAFVAEICARLDGIPLAIELAAARVPLLSAQDIATRLDDCFRLLTGGPRTALPRQQTLRATMDWSYDLLGEPERALLRRLSVFAGGWTLAAAEAICDDPPAAAPHGCRAETAAPAAQPGALDTLDLLTQLVNRSLVIADDHGTNARYRLLEIMRQHARERLQARDDAAAVQWRHARYYLALAEEAETALTGPDQIPWLARLTLEHDNLRAALHWARQVGDVAFALRLAGALWRFWQVRGYVSEGRHWLESLLALADSTGAQIPAAVQARACDGAGALARMQGDYAQASALCLRALQLCRAAGDLPGVCASLNRLGLIAYQQAAHAQAIAYFEESLSAYRDLGDTLGIANVLNNLGMVAEDQGASQRAASCYEASLALFRELGNGRNCATVLNNLGGLLMQREDYQGALSHFEESLSLFRALEDRGGMALVLEHLGQVAARQRRLEPAEACHRRSLALARDLGNRELIAWNLQDLAALAMLRWRDASAGDADPATAPASLAEPHPPPGWPLRAARLFGAAAGLRDALGAPLPSAERPWYDALTLEARHVLGADAYAGAWAAGQALPLEDAIAYALAGCAS
jgi:predicted ATPase/transcriptional regulator with XRE-family HTH domain/Tfp pilus assembly protein PilF